MSPIELSLDNVVLFFGISTVVVGVFFVVVVIRFIKILIDEKSKKQNGEGS